MAGKLKYKLRRREIEKHPTRCVREIEETAKMRFLCPVQIENMIREYSERNNYPYPQLLGNCFKKGLVKTFGLKINKNGIQDYGPLQNRYHEWLDDFRKRGCLACKTNMNDLWRICQICGEKILTSEKCLRKEEFSKDLKFWGKYEKVCTSQSHREIWWWWENEYRGPKCGYYGEPKYEFKDGDERRTIFILSKFIIKTVNERKEASNEKGNKQKNKTNGKNI